jgi:hypothetical protein
MADRIAVFGLVALGVIVARAMRFGSIDIWSADGERRSYLPAVTSSDRAIVAAVDRLAGPG